MSKKQIEILKRSTVGLNVIIALHKSLVKSSKIERWWV